MIVTDEDIHEGLYRLCYFEDGRRDLLGHLGLLNADPATKARVFALTHASVFENLSQPTLYDALRAVAAVAADLPLGRL